MLPRCVIQACFPTPISCDGCLDLDREPGSQLIRVLLFDADLSDSFPECAEPGRLPPEAAAEFDRLLLEGAGCPCPEIWRIDETDFSAG